MTFNLKIKLLNT